MIRRIVLLVAALSVVSFSAVRADEPGGEDIVVPPPAAAVEREPVRDVDKGPDFARNGVYLGVAGTYAFENFDTPGSLDADDTLGLNARLGYRLHPYVSAELEFEWLEGFDLNVAGAEVEAWALTANAKGHLMTGRIQPFLLVGLGIMQAEIDGAGVFGDPKQEGFAARFGGGVDVYATENFVVSVGADYVLPTGDLDGLDYVALQWGFQYRF